MIEVENIHKSFRDNHVLKGLNFSVPTGHITGLVGPNGAGKSTSIRILTGFSDADEGTVRIGDEVMTVNSVEAKRLIGYAPESAPSYREQTVVEYLTLIALLRGLPKSEVPREIDRAVTAFSLHKVVTQAIGTLSKGYRHRVSLAQCLLGDPPVIILDEPTDGLDPVQKVETRKIILELSKTKAVLLTTHLLDEVDMLCDRVVALAHGDIAFSGTMQELKQADSTEAVVYLRVESNNDTVLQSSLANLTALVSADYETVNDCLQAKLSFGPNNDNQDVLNDVSHCLNKHGCRVVELRRDDPPLANIFSYWSNAKAS